MVLIIFPEFTVLSDCLIPVGIILLVLLFEFIIFGVRGLVSVGCTVSSFIDITAFALTD
jgi:hypothetical protein